ncbi:MAG: heavy metal-binding domain-containing protein [Roseiarcus sp.]
MQVSFTGALENGRAHYSIGRVKAYGRWRAANEPGAEIDREAAIRALVREAEDYGADALIDVNFETDEVAGDDIDGVPLTRLVVSGSAVRFAVAA